MFLYFFESIFYNILEGSSVASAERSEATINQTVMDLRKSNYNSQRVSYTNHGLYRFYGFTSYWLRVPLSRWDYIQHLRIVLLKSV